MKIGLVADSLADLSFIDALDWIKACGIEAVEIGTGNFSTAPHCDLNKLVRDESARREYKDAIEARGLILSALNCNGNILDPHPERRKKAQDVFHKTIELAEMLGVEIVVSMSGCPGDPTGGEYPNWVTCFWQKEYYTLYERQWNEELCPFWEKAGKFAAAHGVRIAVEMHHGQAVYNTRTFQRLRAAAGPSVGANMDPSHLFPQAMDPMVVIKALGKDVYYVHAKDAKINPQLAALNGIMDRRIMVDPVAELSWAYRTTGYGHGEEWWADFVSNLQMVGYKGVLSIEHEDEVMGIQEGIRKSYEFLKRVVLTTEPDKLPSSFLE